MDVRQRPRPAPVGRDGAAGAGTPAGWKHFAEGREAIERELGDAGDDVRGRIRWLPIGVATAVAA
jgi:hypothetical protein